MKKIGFIILVFLLAFQGCSSQQYLTKESLNELLASRNFSFVAQRAYPSADGMSIVNNIPNSVGAQLLNIDAGYGLVLKEDKLNVDLPYFGRVFISSREPDRAGIKFDSKDFRYSIKEGKKGSKLITLEPQDASYHNALYLEVSSNGKAYLSINSSDRQPISYSGYLKPIDTSSE